VKKSCLPAAVLAACLACHTPAMAQSAAALAVDVNATPPSPQALGLARTLAAETSTGDVATLGWLSMPLGRLMHKMGTLTAEQSRAVMQDAVIPVLRAHAAELAEIEARTYAAVLSLDDLKAATAFYATPAGKSLIRMHAPLLQANLVAVTQLLENLKPEMQPKVRDALQAHGWTD
jgi:hypothetical protein